LLHTVLNAVSIVQMSGRCLEEYLRLLVLAQSGYFCRCGLILLTNRYAGFSILRERVMTPSRFALISGPRSVPEQQQNRHRE
jgi:hypothetical protein